MIGISLSLHEIEVFDRGALARGLERRFNCPLPGPCAEKRPTTAHRSLVVNTETGMWMCHRCRAKGQLVEFRARQPRREWRTRALQRAFSRTSNTVVQATHDLSDRFSRRGRSLDGTIAADYLSDRRIHLSDAERASVRFDPDWFGRPAVLFPIVDREGRVVAAQGRYLDAKPPKARTAGRVTRGVFATSGALVAEPLIVCEAPIDALSLAAADFPAVALCGTSWPDWLPRLAAFRRVVLATDADAAGDDAATRLERALSFGSRCYRVRPSVGKDFNDDLLIAGVDTLRSNFHKALGRP